MKHSRILTFGIIFTLGFTGYYQIAHSQTRGTTKLNSEVAGPLTVSGEFYDKDNVKRNFQASLTGLELTINPDPSKVVPMTEANVAGCTDNTCTPLGSQITKTLDDVIIHTISTPEQLKEFVVKHYYQGTLSRSIRTPEGVCINEKSNEFSSLLNEQKKKIQSCEVKCYEKPENSDDAENVKNFNAIEWADEDSNERLLSCAQDGCEKLSKLIRKDESLFNELADKLETDYKDETEKSGEAHKLVDKLTTCKNSRISRRAKAIKATAKLEIIKDKYDTALNEMKNLESEMIQALRDGKPELAAQKFAQMQRLNDRFQASVKSMRHDLDSITNIAGQVSSETEQEINLVKRAVDSNFSSGLESLARDFQSGALADKSKPFQSRFASISEGTNTSFAALMGLDVGTGNQNTNSSLLFGNPARGDMPNGFRMNNTAAYFPVQLDLNQLLAQIMNAAKNPQVPTAPNGIPGASSTVTNSSWVTGNPEAGSFDRGGSPGRISGNGSMGSDLTFPSIVPQQNNGPASVNNNVGMGQTNNVFGGLDTGAPSRGR